MKKLFCFIAVFIALLAFTANSSKVNAAPSKDLNFTIDTGGGGGGGGGTSTQKIAYTGIEATLHERSMGYIIMNGGMKNDRWDVYVKINSDGLVNYHDVSNLYLVSYLGEIYPIEGYAEYLNGIIDIQTPKFRVLESKEHFYSGKITTGLEKVNNYNVFNTASSYAVVHYQNGSTDKTFNLAKATNSAMDNPTYLLYKFDSYFTRYYMFKASEVGTTSKITSGSILDVGLSVAHVYTKFNSISEFNKTTKEKYYYINNVIFLYYI